MTDRDPPPDDARPPDADCDPARASDQEIDRALQALIAEHAALATARSSTIFDAGGRASLFVGTVSGAVVALAFVGQISGLGSGFFVFALVLLPPLVFMGVVTFARVIQSATEDAFWARGVNRIRHFYAEVAPLVGDYLMGPTADDSAAAMGLGGLHQSRWQPFLTTAGMIEVITSVLVGVFAGLVAALLTNFSLPLAVAAGVVAFAASLALHHRALLAAWDRFERETPVRFPSGADEAHRGEPRR